MMGPVTRARHSTFMLAGNAKAARRDRLTVEALVAAVAGGGPTVVRCTRSASMSPWAKLAGAALTAIENRRANTLSRDRRSRFGSIQGDLLTTKSARSSG